MEMEGSRPARLVGLEQACYVLQRLAEGKLPPQIVDDFDNDSQLVEIWTNFLTDVGWIKRNVAGEGYTVTEKGQTWLTKLASQKRASSKLLLSTA
jgi:hypothetical protein